MRRCPGMPPKFEHVLGQTRSSTNSVDIRERGKNYCEKLNCSARRPAVTSSASYNDRTSAAANQQSQDGHIGHMTYPISGIQPKNQVFTLIVMNTMIIQSLSLSSDNLILQGKFFRCSGIDYAGVLGSGPLGCSINRFILFHWPGPGGPRRTRTGIC